MSWMTSFFSRKKPDITASPYVLGQQAAQQVADGLDDYLATRIPAVASEYLDVLRKQFAAAILRTDHSPLVITQLNIRLFFTEIELLREQMVTGALSFVIPAKEVFGNGPLLDELARTKAAEAAETVKNAGLRLLRDTYPALEEADDRWRFTHKDQAAREPLDWDFADK